MHVKFDLRDRHRNRYRYRDGGLAPGDSLRDILGRRPGIASALAIKLDRDRAQR